MRRSTIRAAICHTRSGLRRSGCRCGSGQSSPMVAATLGGLLATWVTFAPCFFWIFLCAPFVERLRGNRALATALSAITAAVVGVILNLAVWFAVHTVFHAVEPVRAWPL